jgi:hypothetical protein
MAEWKRQLLIGIGWGLGTALGVVLLLGGFFWYQSRPKPPKPWNSTAIKAYYNGAGVEGETSLVFIAYSLENTTNFLTKLKTPKRYAIQQGHSCFVN